MSSSSDKVCVKTHVRRIGKLKRSIKRVLSRDNVHARKLARGLGQCIYVAWAVTPGNLVLRKSYKLLASKQSRNMFRFYSSSGDNSCV
jgi:hypothetical protein